ncbi:MAG: SRPBCC domain-containing protein [Bacteroidetes bacterium]|nr:SRPBCC domain-containing protein [Bacteroidota bacterium]
MKREKTPLVIEQSLKAKPNTIWSAITDKELMAQWYFDLKEFKAEKGFKFEFIGGPEDGIKYVHLCEVIEVVPLEKLVYTWSYKGYSGLSNLTFELKENGNHTKLKLTHADLDSFPTENEDFAIENFEAGWTYLIGTALVDFLEKREA